MHGMESVLSSLLTSPSGGCAPDKIQAKLRLDLSIPKERIYFVPLIAK